MLLRTLLALLLLIAVLGVGFYFGRVTAPAAEQVRHETNRRVILPAAPAESARARTVEPPPSPPAVAGSIPEGGPPPRTVDEPPVEAGALSRRLGLPIAGLKKQDIQDTFNDARGGGERRHEAVDIMAPRGTPVLAVDSGLIKKLFSSEQGGLTIYQFDSAERFCYYYAHLDRYAEGLHEGVLVKRGTPIGYVGSTAMPRKTRRIFIWVSSS